MNVNGKPYSDTFTDGVCVASPIAPIILTSTTTVNSGPIVMGPAGTAPVCNRGFFIFSTGNFGGTPTLSAVLQLQESSDGISWSNNAIIPSFTLTQADSQSQVTFEINANQVGAGMKYVRLHGVCTIGGGSPQIAVCCTCIGGTGITKPAVSLDNDFSVIKQVIVN